MLSGSREVIDRVIPGVTRCLTKGTFLCKITSVICCGLLC